MVQNKSLIFAAVPKGYPVPGEHLVIKESELDLEKAPENGVITKNLFVSFDPYQRGRMRPAGTKSYTPPYEVGSCIPNLGVGEVVSSNTDAFKKGDIIRGHIGIESYTVLDEKRVKGFTKLDNPHNLPLSNFTGVLGMPGLTAYSSFYKIGQPKKGETIFVSAASGAVGQVVGQLALREGLTVVGSVGSDEKLKFIEELGFKGFNYKKENPHDALKRLAPNGIDIYYENVGGISLEAAIANSNNHARFICCGMISYYNNDANAYYPKNLFEIVARRIKIEGFIVGDEGLGPHYAKEHIENVSKWLANGEMKAREDIIEGIDKGPRDLWESSRARISERRCLRWVSRQGWSLVRGYEGWGG